MSKITEAQVKANPKAAAELINKQGEYIEKLEKIMFRGKGASLFK